MPPEEKKFDAKIALVLSIATASKVTGLMPDAISLFRQ